MIVQKHEWLTIKSGDSEVRLFVRRWIPPAPNGCIVFFVHGVTGSGADSDFLSSHLAGLGYTVISPDLLGHGRSTYLQRPATYSLGVLTRTLMAITSSYSQDRTERVFIGSSWGATSLCLFLAAARTEAAAVIINDVPLEPRLITREATDRFLADLRRRFDSLTDAKENLRRRDAEFFNHRDTDEIAPAVLDSYLASRFIEVDGKYASACDPRVVNNLAAARRNYPDFYKVISMINSARVLLLFGEHSRHRVSETRDRLMADRRNITSLDIRRAGHAPRLLSERQVRIVSDFIDNARPVNSEAGLLVGQSAH